jgi:hypothetical protein
MPLGAGKLLNTYPLLFGPVEFGLLEEYIVLKCDRMLREKSPIASRHHADHHRNSKQRRKESKQEELHDQKDDHLLGCGAIGWQGPDDKTGGEGKAQPIEAKDGGRPRVMVEAECQKVSERVLIVYGHSNVGTATGWFGRGDGEGNGVASKLFTIDVEGNGVASKLFTIDGIGRVTGIRLSTI